MLLHIGGDVTVRLRDVVAVIDQNALRHSAVTREFVALAKAEGRFVAGAEEAKSYVVTTSLVYASPISALTLARRAQLGEVL
jgi:hypothetical protein